MSVKPEIIGDDDADADRALDLRGVLDQLLKETRGQRISVEDIVRAFGVKAYGPLILIPAILLTLPTGVLPGVPLALGAVILLVSGQALIGRAHPWIPRRLRRIEVSRDRVVGFRLKADRWLSRIDGIVKPRLEVLIHPPASQVVALVCILLSLSLIPVEFIPFATAAPGSALILFGLGLTAHDGVLVLLGLAATGGAAALMWWLL